MLTLRFICLLALLCFIGCSRTTPVNTSPATSASTVAGTVDTDHSSVSRVEVTLDLKEPTADEKYQTALLDSISLLAERKYPEALDSLKAAQAARDTDEVRLQITKVQGMALDQATFDRTVADIQAVIDLGQTEEAAKLTIQAMANYVDGPEFTTLAGLKRQADALTAARSNDVNKQFASYRDEADAAAKANNLRASLLAYEQALALKSDGVVQSSSDVVRTRLNQYDAALERASQLRRDPQTLEQAIAAYQDASKVWDTEQVREELADVQLALQQRRDRLAIAPFEVSKNSELVAYGAAFADELLPHFKRRYDLVERSQVDRLFDELKIGSDEIAVSEQGRTDLSRLAQARYLVVGNITPLAGVTVHARLIDLRSGLIVQTAKIVAATPEEASRQMPKLAAMLMLTDEEKLAYERQQALSAAPQVVNTTGLSPQIPAYNPQSQPASIIYSIARPPAFGALQPDEFDRLPAMNTPGVQMMPVEQERPLRLRLLAVQLELGDNFFRRGRHRDALARYQLARELDPSNIDILSRINLCHQYLPPVIVQPAPLPVRRERLAFLNFFVNGDPRLVPPELSTWTPENMIPYYSAQYDVIDRGEIYWMMGRLGLTLGDVVRDSGVRRWLGRALGARYIVAGRIQQTGSVTVTISLLDAELGWEVGRSQAVVRDVRELKLCLPELARMSMLSAAERARLERETALHQPEYLRAQEAYQRGQFTLALDIGKLLRKAQPFDIRIGVFLNQAEERARQAAWENARQQEHERRRQLAEMSARRQAEMALAAERARQEAYLRAAQFSEADRKRQRDLAQLQLVAQARLAVQNNKFGIAIQLFDGALAFRSNDEALIRETAQVRSRMEEARRKAAYEERIWQDEAHRRQRDLELAASRQFWANDRQKWQSMQGLQNEQRQQDAAEYTRLLDQAQRAKAQGRFDQAAAMLQAAKRLKPTDEVDRLLADALMEQARAQAKAEDASKFAELERKLALETARRKQAEKEAQRSWSLYQAAMQQAREAQRNKNHAVALVKYQEALQLFRTDEAVTLWQSCKVEQNKEKELLAAQQKEAAEKQKRIAEIAKHVAVSKAAEQNRKYDEAIESLRRAKNLDPANIDVLTALTRLEQVKIKALESQKAQAARDQAGRVKEYLAQAQIRIQAKQYVAALAILEAAQKLAPGDQQIASQLTTVKKMQDAEAQAIVAARKKEEDIRRLAAQRIQDEEKAKQQAKQAREQAETALSTGDLKAAETAMKSAARLAPNDPALIKLQQELVKAQSLATRLQVQADAKTKLEAQAQARLSAAAKENQGRIGELLKQAQAAIAKKDFGTAEKLIGDALAFDSTNLSAGRVQRELQLALQAEAKAKSAMSAADKKKQDEEQAKKKVQFAEHMKEGKEALAAEDYEKAAKSFTAAKALNPEDPDAAMFLGMANRNSDRTKAEAEVARKEEEAKKKREMEAAKIEADTKKKAEEDLRRKLAMDADAKKRADALKALTRQQFETALAAGKTALSGKKYDDAIKAFEKATQLMPDDREAIAQLTQARKLKADASKPAPSNQPGDKSSSPEKLSSAQLIARAAALQNQKKWNEALGLYRQALTLSPNDKTAKAGVTLCEFQVNFEAGSAALAKKDKQAAIKSLEAALKIFPGHAETQKLLKQAKELK